MKYLIITIVLFSFCYNGAAQSGDKVYRDSIVTPQESVLPLIGLIIEKLSPLILDTKEESPVIIKLAANDKKGKLMKKYNKWLRRKKISQSQYDVLVSELVDVDINTLNNYFRVLNYGK